MLLKARLEKLVAEQKISYKQKVNETINKNYAAKLKLITPDN